MHGQTHIKGRLTLNVFCDHQTQYSLSGFSTPDYEIWPVISALRLARKIVIDLIIVLRPFALRLFALKSLGNLHHFLNLRSPILS
jgi:hypothetical protein